MSAGWKLKTLIQTRRFHTDAQLASLYKAHLLSYLEYRTPAIYHAKRDVLDKLDRVQHKFLKDIGVDDITALMEFNLAPLAARRDMAMLGVLHRAVLGKGPRHFEELFQLDTAGRLVDPRSTIGGEMVKRSALGLVAIYNMILGRCKKTCQAKDFQQGLQTLVKERAKDGCDDWAGVCSPRIFLQRHPLQASRISGRLFLRAPPCCASVVLLSKKKKRPCKNTTTTNFTPKSPKSRCLEMFFGYGLKTILNLFVQMLTKINMLKLQQPLSRGGPKRGNPTMTTSTITARRKGDPQHMLREKNVKIENYAHV